MRYVSFSIYFLLVLAAGASADQFCFALAETYYEQVYCQLQAKAQTKGLPSFNQFKKNDELVQASLLKRPAERNGIKLPAPARKATPSPLTSVTQADRSATTRLKAVVNEPAAVPERAVSESGSGADCMLRAKQIRCGNQVFNLIGNKANQRLAKGALATDNKMNLPRYSESGFSQYLIRAYQQYIDKMCDIGLCGVTMTYRKFAYLYQDLQTKGLDFAERFEIMYSFLKKDKANMGVSESSNAPQGLQLQDCVLLTVARYVCDFQGRNYIFESQ
ncbi:MAG TPA: hypothetical protein VLC79_13185 [Cellvibrio sp.]|nr:hypothetical protein [Cellvibrio sp.]